MKKLNRKGFTLVELLAVIVILAIVVGITLVTVLPTLKKSRQEAFELTAQTAADYIEKQYQLYLIGDSTQINFNSSSWVIFTGETLKLAGLKPENYVRGVWKVDESTGRVCVNLFASTNKTVEKGIFNLAKVKEAGEYYDATVTATMPQKVYTSEEMNELEEVIAGYSVAYSSACS